MISYRLMSIVIMLILRFLRSLVNLNIYLFNIILYLRIY